MLLLYLFLLPRLGWMLSGLTALCVWLNPPYQSMCNEVMSDVPGLTLLLAGLLWERRLARQPNGRGYFLLGVAIGVASMVRSLLLFLTPAVIGAALVRRLLPGEPQSRTPGWRAWTRHLGLLVVGTTLAVLPWSVRNASVGPPPPADQTLLYDYSTAFWHEDSGDPSSPRLSIRDVLARVPVQVEEMWGTLGTRLADEDASWINHVTASWLLLGVVYVLWKRREPAEFFVLAALGLVSVYFGYSARLMLPMYVLMLGATVELLRDLLRRAMQRWVMGSGGAGIVTATALVVLTVLDFKPREGWSELAAKDDYLRDVSARFASQLEPDARLASWQGWHYAVFLDRPVYSLKFAFERARNPDALEKTIDKYGVNTVILSPRASNDAPILPYFSDRYVARRPRGIAHVFRVRP